MKLFGWLFGDKPHAPSDLVLPKPTGVRMPDGTAPFIVLSSLTFYYWMRPGPSIAKSVLVHMNDESVHASVNRCLDGTWRTDEFVSDKRWTSELSARAGVEKILAGAHPSIYTSDSELMIGESPIAGGLVDPNAWEVRAFKSGFWNGIDPLPPEPS